MIGMSKLVTWINRCYQSKVKSMEMIPAMKPFPGWSFSSQYHRLDVLINIPGTSTSSALADSSRDKISRDNSCDNRNNITAAGCCLVHLLHTLS